MNNCFIIGAAEVSSLSLKIRDGDILIASDGGQLTAQRFGFKPDVIIGDFDSSSAPNSDSAVIKLNPTKGSTDTEYAVNYALKLGYKNFYLYGCLGGERISHTLANIQLICSLAKQGVKAVLIDGTTQIFAVSDSIYNFTADMSGYISVFSHTDTAVISESGLRYSADRLVMKNDTVIGISNEFCARKGYVKVENGTALIVLEKK